MTAFFLWVTLGLGCVATMPVPEDGPCETRADCGGGLTCFEGRCELPCVEEECNFYACDPDNNTCLDRCASDDDCGSLGFCERAACVSLCEDIDCDNGFRCAEASATCYGFCYSDNECDDDHRCCTDDRIADGSCAPQLRNDCVERD